MINVNEIKSHNSIHYELQFVEGNNISFSKDIKIRTVTLNHPDGNTYYYLYDEEMNPIRDVFRFLNFELLSKSPNSRSSSLHALKLLYSFCSIFGADIKNLTSADIKNLKMFLKGVSPKGHTITLNLNTQRSNETINSYLGVYRKFYEFLGIVDSPLFLKSNKSYNITSFDSEQEIKVSGYKLQEKVYKDIIKVPQYISVEDFSKIIKVIRNEYSEREECIVRLMFEAGLRIGEVLGLTSDDIVLEEIDGEDVGVIYIRNRFTDKPYQLAKTCMKINNKKQYKSKEYSTQGYGYQKVIININLYDKLSEYINENHCDIKDKFLNNYNKFTIADRVDNSDEYDEDNFYVFINSVAKPLSSNLWNQTLRNIFEKSGIKIDKYKRQNNLNHRFRHGFAMFMVQYKNIKAFDLKILMRHKSIHSVFVYYKPTDEDISKLKNDFAKSLYDIIPDLQI